MFDRIFEYLGFLASIPIFRPVISLFFSVVAACVHYSDSATNAAWPLLLVSLLFAAWSFGESFKGGLAAGVVNFLTVYLAFGLEANVDMLEKNGTLCSLGNQSAEECIDELLLKNEQPRAFGD